jgi:hypothetical protein
VKEAAVKQSDRILVSREVLETMQRAIAEVRTHVEQVFQGEPFDQGRVQQCALNRLLDLTIALEALCPPQI